MSRRKPLPPSTLSADSQKLFDVLKSESDLPAVLIATSYLDECLASLLQQFFIESGTADALLDPVKGPIGTYSSRTDLAYVLGLINEFAFKDLKTIGTIRNAFAHSHLGTTFGDPTVSSVALGLQYLAVMDHEMNAGADSAVYLARMAASPRDRFVLTVVMLANQLLLLALGTVRRPRSRAFARKSVSAKRGGDERAV